jgi:hypothetical protein
MKHENNYDILLADALHSSDNATLSTSTRKRTNKVVTTVGMRGNSRE